MGLADDWLTPLSKCEIEICKAFLAMPDPHITAPELEKKAPARKALYLYPAETNVG
jgi:hypothetical protein